MDGQTDRDVGRWAGKQAERETEQINQIKDKQISEQFSK